MEIGGIQQETKGNRRRENEAKFDFFAKKMLVRLRMCEKSSTFVAKMCVWTKWQIKKHEKLLKNINRSETIKYRL